MNKKFEIGDLVVIFYISNLNNEQSCSITNNLCNFIKIYKGIIIELLLEKNLLNILLIDTQKKKMIHVDRVCHIKEYYDTFIK